jgi:NitT/TauT family transport system substrate-binding protein
MSNINRSAFVALTASALTIAPRLRAQGQSLMTIRIMGNPNDDATSVFYAIKSGLFQKAAIDIHIESGTSGAAVAAAVAGGSFDIGKSSITSIFEAHEKGIPFALLAPAGIQDTSAPFAGMLALKDAPIKTGKDLENQVVGVSSLSSIGRAAVCRWVDKAGGNWHSVQFVEIPLTQAAAAVSQKRVVTSEIAQPALAAALDTGNFQNLPIYQAIAPRFVFTCWFTTKDWSAKHPDLARTFARIVAQSAAFTNTHHSDTAPVMSQVSGVELSVLQSMQRVNDGTTLDPAQVQPLIDASTRYGMLKAGFPARDIIDPNALPR